MMCLYESNHESWRDFIDMILWLWIILNGNHSDYCKFENYFKTVVFVDQIMNVDMNLLIQD